MRTLWPIVILGWPNVGCALPERDANHVVPTHARLAKPMFCIPGARCEPYGAHSFWVGETSVLHSQNEMRTRWCTLHSWLAKPRVLQSQNEIRTLWCTFILGWRSLRFAFPGRDANPMVHTRSGLAKPTCCIPNEMQTLRCTLILTWRWATLWCTFVLC